MKRNQLTHCAVMLAAGVALLLAFGVRASSLLYLGVLLACPLMMFLMMRGMMVGGQGAGEARSRSTERSGPRPRRAAPGPAATTAKAPSASTLPASRAATRP